MSGPKGVRRGRTIKNDGPDLIDVHVGHQLRKARLLAKLNQVGLGNGIGVSFQAVQKYEAGENRLSASRLYKAARLLGVAVSFFFEGIGNRVGAARGGAFSVKEVELICAIRDVYDPEVRAAIVQLIATIGSMIGRK